ncbi:MAG: anti-sigma factor family protein [Acidimicrobiales bacterium]
MTTHDEMRLSLGAYLAGALDAVSRRDVEEHLEDCASCQAELAELAPLPGLLARVGPLVDEDVALPANLRSQLVARIRDEHRVEHLRVRTWRRATTAVGLVAAILLGVVLVRLPSSTPGTSYAMQVTDAQVSLRGTATLVPKAWGTEVVLSLRGVPAGLTCEAVVVASHGTPQIVGNWGSTPTHSLEVVVATHLSVAQLRTVSVATLTGRSLLVARVV